MEIAFVRIIIAAVVVEVLAIVTLVVIVAVRGPKESEAAQAYAERLGRVVGPVAGFVLTLIGGWWVAQGVAEGQLLHGGLTGVAVAAIDIAILLLSRAKFETILAVSNVGRVVAGLIGGALATGGVG